jgi:hypothetical protein
MCIHHLTFEDVCIHCIHSCMYQCLSYIKIYIYTKMARKHSLGRILLTQSIIQFFKTHTMSNQPCMECITRHQCHELVAEEAQNKKGQAQRKRGIVFYHPGPSLYVWIYMYRSKCACIYIFRNIHILKNYIHRYK